jgi:hypothetical protein
VLETTSPSSSVAVMAARPFQMTKIGGTYTDATEFRFGLKSSVEAEGTQTGIE